jgi:F0F1-type ATP synthase assembly protein I
MAQSNGKRLTGLNTLLIVLIGQMGCLTVVVIAISLAAGLWLDRLFNTKPIITLVLLLAGIPVSIVLMVLVGRRSVDRFKARQTPPDTQPKES